jgi:hypothetical protein
LDAKSKWQINTVYAPGSLTTAETFIWYQAHPRIQIGVAELAKQRAFRFLASVVLLPETERAPSLNASVGVQGIGTGNPGYSVTAEKNFMLTQGNLNVYAGLGFRSNENHVHPVAGIKYSLPSGFTFGLQEDGHQLSPFATYSKDWWTVGVYVVGFKNVAYLVGVRF